jgi:hypothetical protein
MRNLTLLAVASALVLTGCETTSTPAPPAAPSAVSPPFSAPAFAWSQKAGKNTISGSVTYRAGGTRFTCAGTSVVLTPETPWSRHRMQFLYGSTEQSALPADEVRTKTRQAPPGDSTPFIKRATCDNADQFIFTNLPDGNWYAITVARPLGATEGGMALMRRVSTKGGKATRVAL